MPDADSKFTRGDLAYYRKERLRTDYLRIMKTYSVIRGEVKTDAGNGPVPVDLNLVKISRMTGLSGDTVRKKLAEIKDLGAIDYERKGPKNQLMLNFIFGEGSSCLDRMLEKDKREKLL